MDDMDSLQAAGFSPVNLGKGLCYTIINSPQKEEIGLHYWHHCLDYQFVAGAIWFNNDACNSLYPKATKWDVVQREPLTIDPSILCRRCGTHGWIREGRWITA